jgi:cation transport ATPase
VAHERWVYGSGGALLASGGLWLLFHHFVSVQTAFGAQPHPLETWWLSMHGGAAMVFLVVLGTLLPVHVRRSWKSRRNGASGAGLLASAAVLTISGYGLYYAGSEALRPWLSAVHWIAGALASAVLGLHVFLGQRSLQRRHSLHTRTESAAPAVRAIATSSRSRGA